MTYEEALAWIGTVPWKGTAPGLERIRALMGQLGDPQKELKCVHVAGTNGKGSTCALLASALTEAGYRTGLYISPHLWRINERMSIGGAGISDAAFAAAVTRAAAAAAAASVRCTEFELLTAAAFLWFAEEGCAAAVLETGLGGRLDATNVIPVPECAVVTNIGLDHTAILGDTLAKIAAEKAGIFKGGDAVSYEQAPEAAEALRLAARRTGTALRFADFGAIRSLADGPEGQTFRLGDGPALTIPLLGEYQLRNAAVALLTLDVLRRHGFALPEEAVRRGFAAVRWPARFELVSKEPPFVVDGGHNPQCAAAAADSLRRYFPASRRVLLLGVMADKDWPAMLDILLPLASACVAVTPASPRALAAEELCAAVRAKGTACETAESVPAGVARARALAEGGMVCAVGSLYMAGAVRGCFGLH